MKLIRKDKKGFTLVELIVVIAILAILALILIPAITGYVSKANDSRDQANARALYSAAVLAESTNSGTAYTNDSLKTEISKNTRIAADKIDVKIDTANNRQITVTYGNWEFDGSNFKAKKDGSGPKATH